MDQSSMVSMSCTSFSDNITDFELFVDPLDNPGFSYPAYDYCTTDTDPTATIDVAGGTFTSVASSGGETKSINGGTRLIH